MQRLIKKWWVHKIVSKNKSSMLPTFLWGAFVFYATLRPSSETTINFPAFVANLHPDKWVHFFLWGIWYYLYHRIEGCNKVKSIQLSVALTLILLGAAIEILQGIMKMGRTADFWDFTADALGVGATYAYCYWRQDRADLKRNG